ATEKLEDELSQHVKKALTPDETAPKQKHVRACIIYTCDVKGSGSFWHVLKTFPLLSDEIVTFKALIVFHKVIRQGHPLVLKDAISEASWLDNLVRHTNQYGHGGYGILIRAYVQFLHAKLQYHSYHPEFSGTFDYQEYVSLKGVEDPNEGFETINDLLGLLDKLDSLQKMIFDSFRNTSTNECRIAALVPLVEESYGIYQFLVSMLMAMHQIIGSVEVLGPLRDKFRAGHYAMFNFYHACSNLRFLTSLITVPRLSQDPPDFLAQGPPTVPPRKTAPPREAEERRRLQDEELARQRQQQAEMERQRQQQLALEREHQNQLEMQRRMEMQRQAEQQSLLEEQQRMLAQQQQYANAAAEKQLLQQRLANIQNQLDNYRNQTGRDAATIQAYEGRIRALEQELETFASANKSRDDIKEDMIRKLQDEVQQWKTKYEALAKLYTQLRKEHLDLLGKFKVLKDAGARQTDGVRAEVARLNEELRSKAKEMTEIMLERDRLRADIDRARLEGDGEIRRLRDQLASVQRDLDQAQLESRREVDRLLAKSAAEREALEQASRAKNDDTEVLKTGLDETLLALSGLQQTVQQHEVAMKRLRGDHASQLNKMMDNVLQSCIEMVDQAVYTLESPTDLGNQTASPEYVSSLVEKLVVTTGEFGDAFVRLVQSGDQIGAITQSHTFANAMVQFLHNVKGVARLASEEDGQADELLRAAKDAVVLGGRHFFEAMKSAALGAIPGSQRIGHIADLTEQAQTRMAETLLLVDKLIADEVRQAMTGDLGDAVDREMHAAAQAIEDAARRLQELMAQPRELNVHGAILQAAIALTTAISNLIRCATATQQEIVAHGRGSSNVATFYKKNNKWTEGLISAAKAVAVATTYLVESADGLVTGSHTYEQLMVAAQEVGVATTQLVAASRVKTVPFSKTQDKLEDAATRVREATKLLVKAARAASQRHAQLAADQEISHMGRHEYKVKEMEQQVQILELEKSLTNARYKLASIRKSGY
ncbi:hypothetical protein CXG81DRAFT_739, partial [Caulochytrium protostelioides]